MTSTNAHTAEIEELPIEESARQIVTTTQDNLRSVILRVRAYLEYQEREQERTRTEVKRLADLIDERNRKIDELNRLVVRQNNIFLKTFTRLWVWVKKILAYASEQSKQIYIDDQMDSNDNRKES